MFYLNILIIEYFENYLNIKFLKVIVKDLCLYCFFLKFYYFLVFMEIIVIVKVDIFEVLINYFLSLEENEYFRVFCLGLE